MRELKYIICKKKISDTDVNGAPLFLMLSSVFTKEIVHADIAKHICENNADTSVYSAGFVADIGIMMKTYGKSDSLRISSKSGDDRILLRDDWVVTDEDLKEHQFHFADDDAVR